MEETLPQENKARQHYLYRRFHTEGRLKVLHLKHRHTNRKIDE
jgi:hypothetical protein